MKENTIINGKIKVESNSSEDSNIVKKDRPIESKNFQDWARFDDTKQNISTEDIQNK